MKTDISVCVIANQIVELGIDLINKSLNEKDLYIDYVAIFSQDYNEYQRLTKEVESIGDKIENTPTGYTYKLSDPLNTKAGELWLIKIRKYDKEKLQRGAPDFRVKEYEIFKEKHINNSNVNLITRTDYEMMELVGNDVLVYFPNKSLSIELGIK